MKLYEVTEKEYRDIVLNETMHYPDFLDDVFRYFSKVTLHTLTKMSEQHLNSLELEFVDEGTTFIKYLTITFILSVNEDLENNRYYYGNATSNGKLEGDKLQYGKITVKGIISKYGGFSMPQFNKIVNHELTHLYDDWNSLTHSGESVFNKPNVTRNYNLINEIDNEQNIFLSGVGLMSYMSIYTENNAFTTQLMSELKQYGCGRYNYNDVLKKTYIYNNVYKGKKRIYLGLNSSTDEELEEYNKLIMRKYPKSDVPKMNLGEFNAEEYKNRIAKWAENLYAYTMRRAAGVVQLYIDRLTNEDRQRFEPLWID